MVMMIDGELMTNTSSSTSRNSDLIRPLKSSNSSSSSTSTNRNHNHNHNHHFLSAAMTVDDAQRQSPPLRTSSQINFLDTATATASSLTRQQSGRDSSKIADDVWKEIVAGGRSCKQEVADEMMTLEDFLAKAEAVEEEDVKVVARLPSGGGSGVGLFSYDQSLNMNMKVDGFGMGAEEIGGGGRGKRRAMLETLDKAAQQRQRRMIKNRESAARSRERKQAYQAELESLAVKLEEENEMLLKVKTEQTRKRYKQLLDNIIPVTEKQRPRKYVMTRARSMEW